MLYYFSVVDLIPYILIYILCLLSSFKNNSILYEITFFFVFIFSALRYGIGYDYLNYVNLIHDYDITSFSIFEWFCILFRRKLSLKYFSL